MLKCGSIASIVSGTRTICFIVFCSLCHPVFPLVLAKCASVDDYSPRVLKITVNLGSIFIGYNTYLL